MGYDKCISWKLIILAVLKILLGQFKVNIINLLFEEVNRAAFNINRSGEQPCDYL